MENSITYKDTSFRRRKCAPLLAAGAGAAICLTNGGLANAVTGNFTASNSNQTFVRPEVIKAFGSQASWLMSGPDFQVRRLYGTGMTGSPQLNAYGTYNYLLSHNSGVSVTSAMSGGFNDYGRFLVNRTNKFYAVKFVTGTGTRFGWMHMVSIDGNGATLVMDTWGFDPNGNGIRTLSESVSAKTLALSDGRVKLNWTNKNEQGVARYELQAKDAAGQWAAIDSDAPGAGRYSTTVAPGDYRLAVEKVDGTVEVVAF